ncbi:MAG: sulfite exporter TauE/SafE family protein, partial [Fimbriimonadaceae bacterium]
MLEILGYLASVLVGVALGLIGGGGSILTVPILVYLFGMEPTPATAYSLFVVGVTALAGFLVYARRKEVDFRTALLFAPPSFLGVYLVRLLVIPNLPDTLFSIGTVQVTRDSFILLLFALLMFGTAFSMIRKGPVRAAPAGKLSAAKVGLIMLEGLAVGALTGFVGAGGGFLVIPALVLLIGLPMKTAVGTSLLIIAVKSLLGMLGDVQGTAVEFDWGFLVWLSALAVFGMALGTWLSKRLSGESLKPAFGWFVLL